ncbi:MAG TPA: hypothetical protein VFI02_06275 [Armatimonadota bacterium]|nr:hypothetical protein [Armatimonadota bacterium]
MKKYLPSLAILTVMGVIIAGCGGGGGGGGGGTTGVLVSLLPSTASIQPSKSVVLTASIAGASNPALTWTHVGGTLMVLDNVATFIAPATAGTYSVTATSKEDSSKSATAQIVVSNSAPGGSVTVTITPADIELSPGDFIDLTATVSGSTNKAVTWAKSGGSLSVTSSTTARFTAPSTENTYTVTATSVADPSANTSIQILVTSDAPPPPPVLQ